jgi:hypothetical protein
MPELETKHIDRNEVELPFGRISEGPVSMRTLTRSDIITSYRVAEFVTLARDGSPVCWPLAPDFEGGRLLFSTGYVYPTKARNAQRSPRVAALFSDPTASGRSDNDPLVLVQGLLGLGSITAEYRALCRSTLARDHCAPSDDTHPRTSATHGWLPGTHLDRGIAPTRICLGA